ncbi:cytochrome P450 734A1-like, partial [Olea europaea var. sylvestris]|uniref:cytochrome P450 734A1-like n=1 Tax=Olea europaea var. sylvestris TaxID=158386 RepID=UPI000C1D8300
LFYRKLVFGVKVFVHLWWIPRKIGNHFMKQGIKGPKYQLFLGNLKELASLNLKASAQPMLLPHNILPRVLSFYHHWKKIYGGTFLVWFGPTPRLTISDPSLIREIFVLKSDYFEKNESPLLVRKLEGDGLLSLKGEKWAHHRKIIQPTFHTENLKLMMPMMAKSIEEAVERWSGEISNAGKVEVEVSEWFQNLVEDAITRTTFGSSYKDGRAIFDLQSQQMVHATEAYQKVFIPGYRYVTLMMPMMAKSIEEAVERWSDEISNAGKVEVEVSEWFQNLVEDAITRTTFGSSYKDGRAIFDLQSQQMVHATEAYQKVFIPGYRYVTLGMILNESLRLYPPAVAIIRRAKIDVQLGGLHIPSGTELLIPILAVHHDPTLWCHDVHEFNPARFANGVVHAAKHPLAFMPFGLGARRCIGQNLAILQAKLGIAMLLQRFSFELAPHYKHAPSVLMLLHPQEGAPIIFRKLFLHNFVFFFGCLANLSLKAYHRDFEQLHPTPSGNGLHILPWICFGVSKQHPLLSFEKKLGNLTHLTFQIFQRGIIAFLILQLMLGMILNESLRLYPPAVAIIRRAKIDVQLGGLHIPSGTELLIPILAVHHDPTLWCHDVHEFNPARFANGVVHAAKHPLAFMPFGLGARRCIGQNLAILQAKLGIAMLLQRFSFELAPHYKHAPSVLMLLHPQDGAPIIFRKL